MPRFILSYDLENAKASDHANFKSALAALGWDACVGVSGVRKKLPETTMFGSFDKTDTADKAVISAEKTASVKIVKYVVGELVGTQKGRFNEDCDT